MQLMITGRSDEYFQSQVNEALKKGYAVIPGTMYATSIPLETSFPIKGGNQFYSVTLANKAGQVMVIAKDYHTFQAEVALRLNTGYTVLPGTIYATYVGKDSEVKASDEFFSVFLWRD